MFCPECGTQIPTGAKFCSNCGKAFSEQSEPAQPSAGVQQTSSDDQPSFGKAEPSFEPPTAYVRVIPLKKSNKKPLIIAACCAAAAAVVLIVLFAVILPRIKVWRGSSGTNGSVPMTARSKRIMILRKKR